MEGGRLPSARALRHAWLTEQIQAIHAVSRGTYGARRIHAELTLGMGIQAGHGAVAALMRRAGIKGLPGNRRPRLKHQTPTAAGLADRQFARAAPGQLWVTGITEHPAREGKVYCAVVLDACSRRVAGWSTGSTQTAALVTNALDMAIRNRAPSTGLITCSDHRVQYTSWAFTDRAQGIRAAALDGVNRGLLRQRHDRVILGPGADRAAELAKVANPDRARQRPVRVPRDLLQPPATPLSPRNAYPYPVRTPSRPRHAHSMTTVQQPGSGKHGAHQSLRTHRTDSAITSSVRQT